MGKGMKEMWLSVDGLTAHPKLNQNFQKAEPELVTF